MMARKGWDRVEIGPIVQVLIQSEATSDFIIESRSTKTLALRTPSPLPDVHLSPNLTVS